MKHMKTLLGLLVLLGALSCTKTRLSSEGGEGNVSFTVSTDYDLVEVTKSSVSDYADLPQTADFNLVVKDKAGKYSWSGLLADWDPATKLPAGAYTVEAFYGSLEEEGFNKPYFYGTSEFAVSGGQNSEVSVEVALANTIVRINCTEMFKNYYVDYSFDLLRGTTLIAEYAKDETKGVFIDGYKLNLSAVFINEVGTEYQFSKEFSNLDPATAYTIEFDLNNVGGSSVSVSFNDTVEVVDLENFELNE